MSDLTAIDVLIDPTTRIQWASRRQCSPSSAAFAGSYTLQPYPHDLYDLDHYYGYKWGVDEVPWSKHEKVIGATDISSLSYTAVKITHADWGLGDFGPTVLLVEVNDKVLEFQAALSSAVATYVEDGGTGEAFVRDPGETIRPTIIDWVEAYVPNQIGEGNYLPHITVGVAKFNALKIIESEPFDAFTVHLANVAVYHLATTAPPANYPRAGHCKRHDLTEPTAIDTLRSRRTTDDSASVENVGPWSFRRCRGSSLAQTTPRTRPPRRQTESMRSPPSGRTRTSPARH
jgi:hypothetical protein